MYVSGVNVAAWVHEAAGGAVHATSQGIGQVRDGKLIAGVAYEGFTGPNIFVHQRVEDAPSRTYWWMVTDYPFNQLGCTRMTGLVEADNLKAIELNENIGFELEGKMKGAGRQGQDVLIYVLWKDKCRFLGWRHEH